LKKGTFCCRASAKSNSKSHFKEERVRTRRNEVGRSAQSGNGKKKRRSPIKRSPRLLLIQIDTTAFEGHGDAPADREHGRMPPFVTGGKKRRSVPMGNPWGKGGSTGQDEKEEKCHHIIERGGGGRGVRIGQYPQKGADRTRKRLLQEEPVFDP